MSKEIFIEKFDSATFEQEQIPFTQLNNKVIQNIDDSYAFHIWAYLQSLPPTWQPNRKQLRNHLGIGEDKLKKHLTYLRKVNLMEYEYIRAADGTIRQVKIRVLNGSRFKLPETNTETEDSTNNHRGENTTSGKSTTVATTPVDFTPLINKDGIKEIGDKEIPVDGSVSFERKQKCLDYLREKFVDRSITMKQVEEIFLYHNPEYSVGDSVDRFIRDISKNNEVIKSKIAVFTYRLKHQAKGYYEDNHDYHQGKDTDRPIEDIEGYENGLTNPLNKPPKKKEYCQNDVLAFQCFEKWKRRASNSLNEKFANKQREFFDYFKSKVFPVMTRAEINYLVG